MDKIIELLKKIFVGDAEKLKMIEEIKIDKQDADSLISIQKQLQDIQKSVKIEPSQSDNEDKSVKAVIASLAEQVRTLQSIIAEQAKKQEEREKAIEEEAKKAHAMKIEKAIEIAIKAGKIPAKNDAEIKKWRNLFEKDYDSAEFALSRIKEAKSEQDIDADDISRSNKNDMLNSLKPEFAKYVENVPMTTDI